MMVFIQEEINKRWDKLSAVSSKTLSLLGPQFTQLPGGHIQTDIATVSSVAGLIILQETVDNIEEIILEGGPGSVLLSEVDEGQKSVYMFMGAFAASNGLDPQEGWSKPILEGDKPIYTCEDMTRKLAPDYYKFCIEEELDQEYWKIGAAMTTMELIVAGFQAGILDPRIGKSIASYYVVAGSKTIPYREALWS